LYAARVIVTALERERKAYVMDVLCIGQIVADVLVKPMQALGFTLDTQLVDTIQVLPGGDCMNTAAALCVTQIGATSGVRSFSETMSFLKSYQ